ncbi:MAG: hypothetical protein OXK76_12670 [Gammaproteobacteria bacterium]|nr:hypothetical protein [Gammaproteobacteria bacterium]
MTNDVPWEVGVAGPREGASFGRGRAGLGALAGNHRRPTQAAESSALLTFLLAALAMPGWAQNDHGDDHADDDGEHHVPLFPTAGNEYGRQGFVRVINHDDHAGEVHIEAVDDTGHAAPEITLAVAAEETVHFNSDDLEDGGAGAEEKGLSGSTGAPMGGDWRLKMTTSLDIEVLAYIRHTDGFLTSMTDIAPAGAGRRYRVAVFNPGSNINQASRLRLINPGHGDAHVEIVGVDDDGVSPGDTVEVTVGEGRSVTLSAADLEEGGTDFDGALGDGRGKWQLNIASSAPIMVMSLMESTRTNQLTNLSSAPMTEFETAREVFDADISQDVVQSKCVTCHVEGGQSGHTPLVFVTTETDNHADHNFGEFKDYLSDTDHGDHDHDDDRPAAVILDKIQGLRDHGGGVQVAADSADFGNMERFLAILEDEVEAEPDDHGDD